jgi:hypothetical protein
MQFLYIPDVPTSETWPPGPATKLVGVIKGADLRDFSVRGRLPCQEVSPFSPLFNDFVRQWARARCLAFTLYHRIPCRWTLGPREQDTYRYFQTVTIPSSPFDPTGGGSAAGPVQKPGSGPLYHVWSMTTVKDTSCILRAQPWTSSSTCRVTG